MGARPLAALRDNIIVKLNSLLFGPSEKAEDLCGDACIREGFEWVKALEDWGIGRLEPLEEGILGEGNGVMKSNDRKGLAGSVVKTRRNNIFFFTFALKYVLLRR